MAGRGLTQFLEDYINGGGVKDKYNVDATKLMYMLGYLCNEESA